MTTTTTANPIPDTYEYAVENSLFSLRRGRPVRTLGKSTPTEIRAIAQRIREVADFFEHHPNIRIKNRMMSNDGVCAIGAVYNARKVGLAWSPFASKNCNAQQTMDVMSFAGLVLLNDSGMPAKQFRNYMRHVADLLDRYADSKNRTEETFALLAVKDPYFVRWANRLDDNESVGFTTEYVTKYFNF